MKLTKIRLVNWHIFTNNTIKIEGNTIITGENGNGKSTLIDAIYYVLSGGDDKKFNTAANRDSERTISTYLRGKLGIEGKTFLRNENEITGHIALEFLDTNGKKKILGTIIELIGDKKATYFYILDGIDLDSVEYVNDENKIISYDELKSIYKDKMEGYNKGVSRKTVRSKIASLLQVEDENNYLELLSRSIAFKPMGTDVNSFINSFLLKEDNVNIVDLQKEIESYREIKALIQKDKDKLDVLESFIKEALQYQENKKKLTYLNVVNLKKAYLKNELEIQKAKNNLESCDTTLDEYQEKQNSLDSRLVLTRYKIRDLESNEFFQSIQRQKNAISELEGYISQLENTKKNYEEKLQNEQVLSEKLNLSYNLLKYANASSFIKLNEECKAYYNEVSAIKNKVDKTDTELGKKMMMTKEQIYSLDKEKEDLENGINTYDERVIKLKNLLKHQLELKYNKEINILPLCECFEITDNRWTNAIEGYLNQNRFSLVLEPEYFMEAVKIYQAYCNNEDIYGINIIDTTKNIDYTVKDNSLYTKIKINNSYCETILKSLLGRVICVDRIEHINRYDSAITTDCMIYKNLGVSKINPRKYAKHYIGLDSQKQRIEYLTNSIANLEDIYDELGKKKKENALMIDLVNTSQLNQYDSFSNVWGTLENSYKDLDELNIELEKSMKNDDLISINDQIEELKVKEKELKDKLNELRVKVNETLTKKGKEQSHLEIAQKSLESNKKNYEFEKTQANLKSDYDEFEFSILNDVSRNIDDDINNINIANRALERTISNGINSYYEHNFEKNLGTSLESIPNYISKYNYIKNTNIVQYNQQAQAIYENARHSFNEKFITSLTNKIKEGKQQISNINRKLRDHPFGQDKEVYSFVYEASKDKDLCRYYKVLTSGKSYDSLDLFSETMNEEEKETIRELFDRITSFDLSDTSYDQRLNDLLDYRKYMSFDIRIKNQYGEEYRFSKIAREKSGGETQTPFYVIIASCFECLLKDDPNSNIVIIYDEAFNNMDEERISTLLGYYKELTHLQFLIGVPTNRAPILYDSMDLAVALIKGNNQVEATYVGKSNE